MLNATKPGGGETRKHSRTETVRLCPGGAAQRAPAQRLQVRA